MLFGSMKESQVNSKGSIDNDDGVKIPDIKPVAFKFLLEYVNGLNPKISNEYAVDLLYLSKKYLIKPIETACISTLKQHLSKLKSVEDIFGALNRFHALALDVSSFLQNMPQSLLLFCVCCVCGCCCFLCFCFCFCFFGARMDYVQWLNQFH